MSGTRSQEEKCESKLFAAVMGKICPDLISKYTRLGVAVRPAAATFIP